MSEIDIEKCILAAQNYADGIPALMAQMDIKTDEEKLIFIANFFGFAAAVGAAHVGVAVMPQILNNMMAIASERRPNLH